MLGGYYIATSGATMEDARQAVIANNLANVNTYGFKKDLMTLVRRPPEHIEDSLPRFGDRMYDLLGGGVLIDKTYTDFSDGDYEQTGNPLDLAIQGEGFFKVWDGDEIFLTRAGNFSLNALNELVTYDQKYKVLNLEDTPIVVNGSDVVVGVDGALQVDGATAGRLDIVSVENMDDLEKIGKNLFRYRGKEDFVPGKGRVLQHTLEKSTVSAVEEMVRMIEGMRAYEMNMRLIRYHDTILGQAVNNLGRLPS